EEEGGEGEEDSEAVEEGEEGAGAAQPTPAAIYIPLKPPIIVNFEARGRQRFLQAEVTLMVRTDQALSAAELHMPMIRNALVMLFSGQIYEELQTPEGKELARQLALEEVQSMMEREIGEKGVEQVLFTNFVMQ
ncbi:MAG: flagellar basal body-associated FliL family protein, partial [Cellvibrionaceae bacterium]|nr:flagellar basal body-associated FliL family protein [Cellvibrionaceae bacterium]